MARLHRHPLGLLLAACVWAAAMLPAPAYAREALRGLALVIGNGKYEHLAPLANPDHDARAVEKLLADLGFQTTLSSDRDARRLSRDLRDFVDDAKGADVAVLYYAGHGIEAGGENWLVPVDADFGALDDAGGKLVPLSAVLADLQATVGITIVLLDACRDNPFPPGATLKLASGEAAPVSAGGLAVGDTRGASRLAPAAAPANESLGAVIGFAAEPGRVALDGAPGENSPYAAALIRHLSALAGAEFGQVMRIIGEEVYLKTAGRQRPWVNESLRRLLYFGGTPAEPGGAEGDILAERRQLLLTIAALPGPERLQVEAVARDGGVPLDAIYAVLAALGQEAPDDPRLLDRMLRDQAERVKKMQDERKALSSTDPEITRLVALADDALGEGALKTAIQLNERAKERVRDLSATVDTAEEQVRARRIEFAQVYVRSAEAYELAAEFGKAAADWEAAHDQVARHDAALASTYKLGQSRAVQSVGHFHGSLDTLEQATELAREAMSIAASHPHERAVALRFLGDNLYLIGWHGDKIELVEQAIEVLDEAVELFSVETAPGDWAQTQLSLGNALEYLAWVREDDEERRALLNEAAGRYDEVMTVRTREDDPLDWAQAASLASVVVYQLASLDSDMEQARKAMELATSASEVTTEDEHPEEWSVAVERLGNAYRTAGQIAHDAGDAEAGDWYDRSIRSVRTAIDIGVRPPTDVANALNNMGDTYLDLWDLTQDRSALDGAESVFAEAVEVLDGLEADETRDQANRGLEIVRDLKAGR